MKYYFSILTVLLLAVVTSSAQNLGKLILSDFYHEQELFEFMGQRTVLESDLKIDVYENMMLFFHLDGQKVKQADFYRINDKGERVYHIKAQSAEHFFTLKKNGAIDGSYGFTYTRGLIGTTQSMDAVTTPDNEYIPGQPRYVVCPVCHGTGRDQGRIQYNTNGGQQYCPTCGTTSLAHDHIYSRCGRCDGTGTIKQH